MGLTYDANGNVLGYNTAYDVENRLVTQGSTYYVYDPQGKRVRQSGYDLVGEQYFYGIGGQKLATYQCGRSGAQNNWSCGSPAYNT